MDVLPALSGSRFLIRRCLGSGGFGTVYEALDSKRNALVAIKVLHSRDPDDLHRFKREFRAVSDLSHPNLVTLYELAADQAEWFISMELLDGTDVLSYLRGAAPDTADSLIGSLPQTIRSASGQDQDSLPGSADCEATPAEAPACSLELLARAFTSLSEGLLALHRAGHLHRDIKPRNVLCTWTGRVVLLDFGLACDVNHERRSSSGHAVGTPGYMSPEQAEGLPLAPASDWYSVGVLLYEALTGRLPFAGTALQVLRRKIAEEAPPPLPLRPDTPPALLSLCRRLLSRQPELRPGGDEVLAVLGALQHRGASPGPVDCPEGALPRPAPFIGRGPQLAALRAAYQESRKGRAIIALCHGESGAGKSTLCRRFLQQVAQGGAVVLDGRCYEHEEVPFKALDGVIDALARALKRRLSRALATLLPRDVAILARLFPVLLQVPEIQAAPARSIADQKLAREAAILALRELLLRLSDRHPVVLCIDDLQWGDADGTALLLQALAPPDPPPLLLVASYRSGEQASSPALHILHDGLRGPAGSGVAVREVPLAALSGAEARELAQALLPAPDPARAAAIAAESGGNPLFVSELARLVQTDAAPGPASASLDQLVRARVARLPEESRRLLEVIAVAGRPIARAAAARAALCEEGEAGEADELRALAPLRAGRLVRVGHAGGAEGSAREELLPYHDRVREAIVDGLSAPALAAHHLRLGQVLLGCGEADPERLLYHFQHGGDIARAARYAVLASIEAQRALAFDQVVRLCQAALATGALTGAEDLEVSARLADALVATGRPWDASAAYLTLAGREGPARALERRRQAARQLIAGGYLGEGMAVLRQVLAAVGMPVPGALRSKAAVIWYCLLLLLRGRGFRERPASAARARVLARLASCEVVSSVIPINTPFVAYYSMRALWMALRIGAPRYVALGLMGEALVHHALGVPQRRVLAALDRAGALAAGLKDPYLLGSVTLTRAHSVHMEGQWRRSSQMLEEAAALLRECPQALVERDLIAALMVQNLHYLGDLRALAEQVPRLLRSAIEDGRRNSEDIVRLSCGFLLDLRDDDPDRAEASVQKAEQDFAGQAASVIQAFALSARLMILLYRGDGPAAWRLLQARHKAVKATGILSMPLIGRVARNLRALSALAAAQPPRIAEAEARRLLRAPALYAAPMARLILALCRDRRGRRAEALALLSEAEAGFAAAEMALHAAGVRLRRGEWLGGDEGARLRESARAWMAGQGVRSPERMARMLVPLPAP